MMELGPVLARNTEVQLGGLRQQLAAARSSLVAVLFTVDELGERRAAIYTAALQSAASP